MASFYENLLNKRKGLHNSHRTGLEHQHGRRFIVLGHQHGRRDVMWKHFTAESTLFNYSFSFLGGDFHYRVFLTAFTGKDEVAPHRPLWELRIFVSHSVFGASKT